MNKLPDINYALMAQLSYLKWNDLKKEDIENFGTNEINYLLKDTEILEVIKTDFYNNPSHYPSNETIAGEPGKLEPYTYHEEDKRLFLVYSLDKTEKRTPLFENIVDGWEYLDCATGEIIQNKFFPPELLKGYEDSGFFGVAFQRKNDIMIAYRGTEFELAFARDVETDFNIYFKETDIQQVEAVLFYEYIKTKYGKSKNIHITGHSLAGAIAQYVHFYAYCNNDNVFTETWNGLGAYGSIITASKFSLTEKIILTNDSTLAMKQKIIEEQKLFSQKLSSIKEECKGSQSKLETFYSLSRNVLENKRENLINNENILNYFMHEDFVAGYLNGDWIGKKEVVDIPKKDLKKSLLEVTPKLLLVASLFKNGKYSLKNKDILTKVGCIYLVSSIGGTVDTLKDKSDEIKQILRTQPKTGDLLEFLEVFKTLDMSGFTDLSQDMVYPLLNLFDEDGLTENLKENLSELRRLSEKSTLGMSVIGEAKTAFKFHSVNNFLAFMKDDGNIDLKEMRKEFRKNALKTIVELKKDKNYRFLKGVDRNTKEEIILEIENNNIEKQIYSPANRLVVGNVFTPFPITQTDILFRETFINKKFNDKDMMIIKNKKEGVYNGELILGEYNNLNELGGIKGQSPLIIKIYPVSLGEEEKLEEKEQKVISFGITRTIHSLS